jgi:hypothetical protein
MSYGIEIQNADGRIVIDGTYSNYDTISPTISTATANSSYPGIANTLSTDLVFGRASNTSNGLVGRTLTTNVWNKWLDTVTSNYYVVRRFDQLNSNVIPNYGLAVYSETGNVLFSSNIAKNFEIIVTGTFNSKVSNTINTSFPSATTWYSDFHKYYCVINNTRVELITIPFPFAEFWFVEAYRYLWANSTHGRITIENYLQPVGGNRATKDLNFDYMIVKEIP